ncbi:hypothetical protein P8625_08960 [Tenacibaculum tangerinum]|uniref:Uncharacterized protein n=1 Tax=Tenacibaculum tangerinum TaxID=3038772 RepID=A0ABY8L219_9FLAO|nr:hypothetical protein [Tenacibaculum tangerinum]WGH74248.1 hypothetical protein P8625_08960 [Tenacibaculum tangerinum]
MSSVNNALTLKQILLGISDSLNEAQNHLRNIKPYDEFGRPNTLYTLPYLDFNLQVEAEFEKETTSEAQKSNRFTESQPLPYQPHKQAYEKTIAFKPVTNSTTNSKETNKITSTISGRFVAIVPNEGLPQLIINAVPKKTTTIHIYDIDVEVINAAGEKISDALVEFNYNQEKTEKLNPNATLNHGTSFLNASEIRTDENGKASAQVKVDAVDVANGHILILDVNIGNVLTKISIQQ